MVLEGWGHEVGLVLIMDTPRPDQVRPVFFAPLLLPLKQRCL